MSEALRAAVLRKDSRGASALAAEMGAEALRPLAELSRHEDWEVREAALLALSRVHEPATAFVFLRALDDDQPVNRGTALRALAAQPVPENAPLLEAFDGATDAADKADLAFLLGRWPGATTPQIHERWDAEADPTVKGALLAALAARGDHEALATIREGLEKTTSTARLPWFERARYAASPAFLPVLRSLLGDTEELVYVSGLPGNAEELRACDIALQIAVDISRGSFPFPVKGPINYTTEQLDAVRVTLPER